MPTEFNERLLSFFEPGLRAAQAGEAMRVDFMDGYTGSRFELLADSDPDRITPDDLVAVSMLGAEVPPAVKVWLLDPMGQAATTELLAKVPADLDLWDTGRLIEGG